MKLFLFFICLFSFSANATTTADVASPNVTEGQVIELRLSSDTSKKKEPDLSVLDENFHILAVGQSSSYQNINGKITTSQDRVLNLLPKKTGVLTIPSITWDNEKSQSLQVSVHPAETSYEMDNEKNVLITGTILEKQIYENAALTYRAQVMSNFEFNNYKFYPPEMNDAEVIPVGDVKMGQKTKDGTVYRTLTQDFVIFPQKSGSEEELKGASFYGLFFKRKNNRSSALEPFIYGHLSAPHDEIILRAENQRIEVLPRPQSSIGKWWLPARKVTLSESYLSDLNNMKVGESITRTIEVKAYGVMGTQLPDIVIPSSDDFKVYAETPQKNTAYHSVLGVEGTLKQSFVFVPLKSGDLSLPEVKINWFNTDTKQEEESILPSKTILIQKNTAIKEEVKIPEQEVKIESESDHPTLPAQQNKYAKENNFLYFLAGLSVGFVLLLLSVIIFLRPRKKKLPDLYPNK